MTVSTGFGSYVGGQLRGPLAMVGGFARMCFPPLRRCRGFLNSPGIANDKTLWCSATRNAAHAVSDHLLPLCPHARQEVRIHQKFYGLSSLGV